MKIILDRSPYYCLIEDKNTEQIIQIAREILAEKRFEFIRGTEDFQHSRLLYHDCQKLISLSTLRFLLDKCSRPYASIFSTKAGYYYRAHKDGQTIRYAMNYIIDAGDGVCETHWYSDEVAKHYEINSLGGTSRELEQFDSHNHTAVESTVFQNNSAMLFNTDIYHDFDNRSNTRARHVLTLRYGLPSDFYFEHALLELEKHACC
jgi:hypothetical protein